MPSDVIESLFPQLRPSDYQITSPNDIHYNCIAWAADDNRNWWEPSGWSIHYWPPDVPMEYSLPSYIRAYTRDGYVPCQTAELEPGYEKIAIYVDSLGIPSHAARQKESGMWTSKLGELEDIEHTTLGALEGGGTAYGTVAQILKRPRHM